jgi:hypothetical protein
LKKYAQLTALIFKHGKLRHSGEDFHENRVKSLTGLEEFIPENKISAQPPATNSFLWKNAVLRNLVSQGAFIKSSFHHRAGHLTANGISYIRIPKAASTSVSLAMLEKHYPGLKEKMPDETQINFLTDLNLETEIKNTSTEFFTVVRDPFKRLVSVYRDFFETPHLQFLYRDYLFGILEPKISFAEFVNRIHRIPDRVKDQHLKPQHFFVKPYEDRRLQVTVFKLEEQSSLQIFLNAQGMNLTHRNKSDQVYDYTLYFDRETLQKTLELYRIDIEKFGYQPAYEQLKASLEF